MYVILESNNLPRYLFLILCFAASGAVQHLLYIYCNYLYDLLVRLLPSITELPELTTIGRYWD